MWIRTWARRGSNTISNTCQVAVLTAALITHGALGLSAMPATVRQRVLCPHISLEGISQIAPGWQAVLPSLKDEWRTIAGLPSISTAGISSTLGFARQECRQCSAARRGAATAPARRAEHRRLRGRPRGQAGPTPGTNAPEGRCCVGLFRVCSLVRSSCANLRKMSI